MNTIENNHSNFSDKSRNKEEEVYQLQQIIQEMEREEESKRGVPGLNTKFEKLIEFLSQAAIASEKSANKNIELQDEVKNLTSDLKKLTIVLLIVGVIPIVPLAYRLGEFLISLFGFP